MMFESFSKKRNLRIPRRTEVLTIFGVALGLPAFVLVRLRLNFDRNVFYVLGLCLLGGAVALVFRSFRSPDEM
jgi:NhaP-type Na+/H+ or K+/H+ antiporter